MNGAASNGSRRLLGADARRLRSTFWRYSVLGAVSVAINVVVVSALRELGGQSAAVAGAAGYAAVLVLNFVMARRHVFMSSAAIAPEMLRYGLVQLGMRLAEYLSFLLLVYSAGLSYPLAIVVVAGVFFLVKFGLYRGYVFGPGDGRDDTAKP